MSYLKENRRTLWLASPMIASQLGQMLMGWVDTVMVGHLGVVPLAACAFANTVVHVFLVFGFGLVSSVSIRSSQEFGAKRPRETGEVLLSGTVLAALTGLSMALLIHGLAPWLHSLGQAPEVVDAGTPFLMLVSWSVLPALITTVGKDYSESLTRPWLPFWIILGGVFLNIILNWLLIYGRMGFPEMGLTGAGVSTLASRIAVAATLYLAIFRGAYYQPYLVRRMAWQRFTRQFRVLLKLGWPSGLHLLSEVGLFAFSSLMMGWISVQALAAHQVAMTCAGTAFMFPLGLAFAVTVRVGHAVGAGETSRIRPIAFGAIAMGLVTMLSFTVLFLTGGEWVARLFISDPQVLALAATLLIIAGIFQVFDGCQILAMGGLRGLGDVRVPMLFVYIAYWGIALPSGYWLAFHAGWNAVGLWTGMALGLGCTAVAVMTRLWIMSGRPVAPVVKPVELLGSHF